MELQQVFQMNGGTGENSYAKNSTIQGMMLKKVRFILEEATLDLCGSTFPKILNIADLGCSSGPNTFYVISKIIEVIYGRCLQLGCPLPEFQVLLNDLPGNDFNTIFRSLPDFSKKLEEEKGIPKDLCFIAGVPGTFYGRLFPRKSLHMVHSSNCLHWLSQVPPGLQNELGVPLNKGNIYLAETSPSVVFKAYYEQFQRDFSLFLRSRAEEMTPHGHMFLLILGRRSPDPPSKECCSFWQLMALALNDMAAQGIIEGEKVDSFNLPLYTPSIQEVEAVVDMEGSFSLHRREIIETNWDPSEDGDEGGFVSDEFKSGQGIAKYVRAALESLLASHFGDAIMDDLFRRYGEKISEHLSKEKTKHISLVTSMTRRRKPNVINHA